MQFGVAQNYKIQKNNQYNSIETKFLLEKEIATKLSLYDRIIERIDAIEKELPNDFNQNTHKPLQYDHVPIGSENSTCIDQNLNGPFSLVEFYPYRSNKLLIKNKQSRKISSVEQMVQKEEDKKLSTQTKCLSNRKKSVAESGDNAVLKVNKKNETKEEKNLKQKIISIPKVPPLPPALNREVKNFGKKNQKYLVPLPPTLIQNKLSPFNEPKKTDDFLSDLIKSKKSLKRPEINVENKQNKKESDFLKELKLRIKTRNNNSSNLPKIEQETIFRNSIHEKSVKNKETRPESSFSSSTSKYFTACTYSNKSNSTRSKIKNQEEVSLKSEQNLETEKEKKINTFDKSNFKKNTDSESFKISSSWTLSEDSDLIEKRTNEIKSLLAMKNFLVSKSDTNDSMEANNLIIKTESDESSRASIQINGLITSKKFKTDKIPKSRSEEHAPFSSKANDLLQKMKNKDTLRRDLK